MAVNTLVSSRTTRKTGEVHSTFANGNKYVGEYKDGKTQRARHLHLAANGNKYVGEFKDGKYNGQGTYTSANGSKYVGEFKDGKQRAGHTPCQWQ